MIKHDSSWKKSHIRSAILHSLAAAGLSAGMIACMVFANFYCRKGAFNRAKAFDNYRLEELQKVKEQFEKGEITQSEFDIRVSYINGTEDVSVFRNIWVDEGHEECCEELYKTALKQTYSGAALAVAGVILIGGAGFAVENAHQEIKDIKRYC